MKTVSIISPVYREAEGISLFHNRLLKVLDGLRDRYCFHVLYVLDKSPDRSEEILSRICNAEDDVSTFVLSRRFGHQASLLAGIDHARGDALIMLNSDLQHPPELIPAMLEKFEAGSDIVQMVRRDGRDIGIMKRSSAEWFYRLLAKIASVEIPAGAADFRLLSDRVAQVFRTRIREQNQFLRGLVSWVGFEVSYIPFACEPRKHGTTNYRLATLFNFAIHGICSFSKAPLRLCALTGMGLAVVSLLLTILQIIIYFFSNVSVAGWATLMTGIFLMGGLQLFFLGIVGEYVSLVFDEVKHRPQYLVDRVYGEMSNGRMRQAKLASESDSSLVDKSVLR